MKTYNFEQQNKIFVSILIILSVGLFVFVSRSTSTNHDEAANIVAGISIWKYGCFDLYPVNPPFVKLVAAVPFLFHQPDIDWQIFNQHLEQNRTGSRPEFSIGLSLVRQNTNLFRFIFFLPV